MIRASTAMRASSSVLLASSMYFAGMASSESNTSETLRATGDFAVANRLDYDSDTHVAYALGQLAGAMVLLGASLSLEND